MHERIVDVFFKKIFTSRFYAFTESQYNFFNFISVLNIFNRKISK